MYYIYARTRDGHDKHYWNRRTNDWQTELTTGCYYPTERGANQVYHRMVNDGLVWRTFNAIGWKHVH